MKYATFALSAAAALFIGVAAGGCCTMFNGFSSWDTVTIVSTPPGAYVRGVSFDLRPVGEGKFLVRRGDKDAMIEVAAEGYQTRTAVIRSHENWWVLANILNGFIPGAGIDFATDCAYYMDGQVTVALAKDDKAGAPVGFSEACRTRSRGQVLRDNEDAKKTEERRANRDGPPPDDRFRGQWGM
jgi:hypothetical protein